MKYSYVLKYTYITEIYWNR